MKILNRIFDKNPSDDVTKSLGNMIISGVENEGNRKLYTNMLMELLQEKKTLFIVDGSLTREQYQKRIRFVAPHMIGGRMGYDLNLSDTSDTFDILSAFSTSEQKADFVISLMTMTTELPALLKNRAYRIYLYAFSTLDLMGKDYRLKDLLMMTLDDLINLINASSLSASEKALRVRFLSDAGTYSSFFDIESCMIRLDSIGLLHVFSGNIKVQDMLSDGNVILLNGMKSDDFEKKEPFFNAVFYALSKCLEICKSKDDVAFLIKNADFISGDHIKNTLAYNLSYHFAVYFFIDDITRFIEKNGASVLDEIKSCIVFCQGSEEGALFWSAFFGNRDKLERSFSYTKKKSLFSLPNPMNSGGVIATPRKYNTSTTNVQKVNKPNYEPEKFRELKPLEIMIYLREPLMRRKARIEE